MAAAEYYLASNAAVEVTYLGNLVENMGFAKLSPMITPQMCQRQLGCLLTLVGCAAFNSMSWQPNDSINHGQHSKNVLRRVFYSLTTPQLYWVLLTRTASPIQGAMAQTDAAVTDVNVIQIPHDPAGQGC